MRAEYQMLDGLRVRSTVRDGVVPGDRVEMPIALVYDELKYDAEGPPETLSPMMTRSYEVTGYESIAILKEIF